MVQWEASHRSKIAQYSFETNLLCFSTTQSLILDKTKKKTAVHEEHELNFYKLSFIFM